MKMVKLENLHKCIYDENVEEVIQALMDGWGNDEETGIVIEDEENDMDFFSHENGYEYFSFVVDLEELVSEIEEI